MSSGKLLNAVGEDNVLWGSDSIWYGPTQPAIDAFRAFQIPVEMRERYGYPELTPERKAKILGLNAARVYGLDPAKVRERTRRDEMGWVRGRSTNSKPAECQGIPRRAERAHWGWRAVARVRQAMRPDPIAVATASSTAVPSKNPGFRRVCKRTTSSKTKAR